jgi:structural maintenance of chromosome 3 (chondroitin sulfate proteoglycan 6)
MRDLVRSLTEVECLIDDLNDAAGEGEQRRGRLETELDQIETRVGEVETELAEVEPEWRQRVQEEKEEKQT